MVLGQLECLRLEHCDIGQLKILRTGTWNLVPCYHRDIPYEMLRNLMTDHLGTGNKGHAFQSIAQDAVDLLNEVVNHVVMLILEDTERVLERVDKKTIVPKYIKSAICDDEDFEKLAWLKVRSAKH